jgi:hypothetical protein
MENVMCQMLQVNIKSPIMNANVHFIHSQVSNFEL